MCILFIAVEQHPDYPLIIAANRDEFHARPTAPSSFWQQHPQLLAGRDLKAGGTWMGMTTSGKIAALTNIRDPENQNPDAQSRGELAINYLLGAHTIEQYQQTLGVTAHNYNGYNLLFGEWNNLFVYNNQLKTCLSLSKGVHGLSNASLNAPWPKVTKGMQALTEYCQSAQKMDEETLFNILADDRKADDHTLPQTGVPYEWEKKLSSIFIEGSDYGTRCSTLLLVDKHMNVHWKERSFNSQTLLEGEESFAFSI